MLSWYEISPRGRNDKNRLIQRPLKSDIIDPMRILVAILFFLLLFLQYRLWVGEGSLAEVNNLENEITRQEAALVDLKNRNRALQAEVEDLRSGSAALEERARSELGMIKEGEVFYQVIDQSQITTQ